MQGYEQSKADLYVFRKLVEGEADVVMIVRVDNVLVSTHGHAEMEQLIAGRSKQRVDQRPWRGELVFGLPHRAQQEGAGA